MTRLRIGIPSIRRKPALRAFQRAIQRAQDFGLHVLHYSILSNHIHMIVEAKDKKALRSGMSSIATSFAIASQRLFHIKGAIFHGRYHLKVIRTIRQMRNTLEYVLLNYCKHVDFVEHIDSFSSGGHFPHWRKLIPRRRWNDVLGWGVDGLSDKLDTAGLSRPRSWLARQGWMRAAA